MAGSPEEKTGYLANKRRVLPHNIEAEQAVIGGILFNGKSFPVVAELLEPIDFYMDPLRAVFEAMVHLDDQSRPIDMISVAEQMKQDATFGKLRAYNGEAYLADLATQVATTENISYHAQMVRDKAVARRLVEGAAEVVEKGYTEYADVKEYIDQAQRIIFEATNRTNRPGFESIRKVLREAIKNLEHRYHMKDAITGVPTGYSKLDAMTTGLQPGELIIIAARPSMGKTAFALNCAYNAAVHHKIPALVFSLEMSKESLAERLICSEAKIDSQRLRSGFMTNQDWLNITKASGFVAESPLWIDDSGSPTLMEIRSKARRWRNDPTVFPPATFETDKEGQFSIAARRKMGVIVVDYLQLIQGRAQQSRDNNREREISEISRGLKALAKELSVPVVALSQLNRSVESRADKRPMASDLRESGAIEQDADVICFIYRDEVYNKESPEKGVAELIIGKQRNGPTGTVKLAFLNQYTKFENLAEGRDND